MSSPGSSARHPGESRQTTEHGWPGHIAAVIFDFDDTLADTFEARRTALQRVFDDEGFTQLTAAQFMRVHWGMPFQTSLPEYFPRAVARAISARYRAAYWTGATHHVRLYDGVLALLQAMRERGLPMAVLTSKHRRVSEDGYEGGAQLELERLGIAPHFRRILGFEDVRRHKPDPEGVHALLGEMGVAPSAALLVGDSAADMLAARNAGCWSALARWGVPDDHQPIGVTGDVTLTTPHDLRRHLLDAR
ncbi:MAG: HAD family hydrolase [SAR202 cluster bacterium]|nr:HAD family hydrolase [SAR202 cluster bacterium]